jgi:hypothetical protein
MTSAAPVGPPRRGIQPLPHSRATAHIPPGSCATSRCHSTVVVHDSQMFVSGILNTRQWIGLLGCQRPGMAELLAVGPTNDGRSGRLRALAQGLPSASAECAGRRCHSTVVLHVSSGMFWASLLFLPSPERLKLLVGLHSGRETSVQHGMSELMSEAEADSIARALARVDQEPQPLVPGGADERGRRVVITEVDVQHDRCGTLDHAGEIVDPPRE